MKKEIIINTVTSRKKGVFTSIEYFAEAPVRASMKTLFSVKKIVEKTVRFGVKYSNIATVKATESEGNEKKLRKNPYITLFPNTVYENSENGQLYIQFAKVNKTKSKKTYLLISAEGNVEKVTEQDLKNRGILIDSYWSKKESPEVQKIKIENIIAINGINVQ